MIPRPEDVDPLDLIDGQQIPIDPPPIALVHRNAATSNSTRS